MNKILLIIALVLTTVLSVNAQKKELDSLTFKQTQDINFFRKIKNNTKVAKYITATNNLIKIGDTLILGVPTSQEISTRTNTASAGNRYRAASSRSRSTTRKTYEYIQMGRPAGFGSIMGALAGEAPIKADVNFKNTNVVVKELKAYHKGSKKKPLYLIMVLGEINGRAFGLNKYLSVLNTELAVEFGEIRLKNAKMTRDEAIAKLKEQKDLLDLGIISQEDFDKLRKELTTIIMNKN